MFFFLSKKIMLLIKPWGGCSLRLPRLSLRKVIGQDVWNFETLLARLRHPQPHGAVVVRRQA